MNGKVWTLAAAVMLTATALRAQGAASSTLQLTLTDERLVEYAANEVKSLHIDKETGTVTLLLTSGETVDYVHQVKHIGFGGTKGKELFGNLTDYGALKNYVNRAGYPNFRLGCATSANVAGQMLNKLNFDEVVAENDFKYASVVSANGTMNFNTVKTFVRNATNAGLQVYGHCLAWHSQQQPAYLNGLITLKNPGVEEGEVIRYTFDDGVSLNGWGNNQQRTIVSGSYDGSKCLRIVNPSTVQPWESQVAADFTPELTSGETYTLHFWAKASKAVSLTAGLQYPSSDAGYPSRGEFGAFDVTTEWQEYTLTATVSGTSCTRLLFNIGAFAGTLYLDDVTLTGKRLQQMSDEQKREVLTAEMERWIKGMLTACEGKVKGWDVVNEVISDGNTASDGFYALRHGGGENDFVWQDHMGDLEYVRTAVRLARQYGPEDIQLFINDYNLESDWDDNRKLRSLIKWIERWEADGVTHIDGIGTQMHINCSMNATTLASRKRAITNMFKLMAATGKLVRVSELDMGLQDASGNTVMTDQVTEAQHQAMADFYRFIVDQYLTIVPPEQQWGICHWSIGDSPNNQWAWRGGEPLGLWNEAKTQRKPAFKGFADGLAGYQ